MRSLRILGGLFAFLAIVAAIGFGGLMLRLSQGPIEIDPLGARVAAALTKRFNGAVQFSFGATRIAQTAHGPTITVDRLQAVAAGRSVVEAPRAELSLDPLALLRLEALPRRLEVFDLAIRLLVLPDGALAISAGGPNEEAIVLSRPGGGVPAGYGAQADAPPAGGDQAPDQPPAQPSAAVGPDGKLRRSAVLKEAATALRTFFDLATSTDSPLAALHSVAVHGGKLMVDDRTAERTTTFEQLELAFEKNRSAAAFMLRAHGPNGKISAVARATGTPSTERRLDIEVSDLTMDEIGLIAGQRRLTVDSDATLSFKLRFILEANKELREASGRVGIGAGYVRMEDPNHEPLFFDEITGGFHWDPANRRIIIDPVQYFGGATRFVAGGALEPPVGAQDGWRLTLGLTEPGGLGPERPNDKFMPIDRASVEARIFPLERRCDIVRAEIAGPDIALAAAGAIDWVNGPHLRLGASAAQMPLLAMFRVWPSLMGAPGRAWLIGHVHGGIVKSAKLAIDFDKDALLAMRFDRPPPDASLQIDLALAGGSVTALDGVPDIAGVDGTAHVTGRTAQLTSTAGFMETAPGRKLTLSGGTFSMPGNDGSPAVPARLDVRLAGPVEAVADLLAKDPIRDVASLPLESDTLKGQVDGKLRLDFKIGSAATSDDVKVFVNAAVANFSADRLIGKEKFEAGALTIVGEPSGIHATGTGRLFGAPATLDLRKTLGQPASAVLTATIDDAARAKIGANAPGVSGPIGAKINAVFADAGVKAGVDLDLSKSAFDNPVPGLTKPAGRPGRATFNLVQRENTIRIEDLVFEAAGASARGAVDFNAKGELQSARLTQAKLSPGDDMRLEAQRAGEGVKITVRGPTIDARPFLKILTQTSEANSRRDVGEFELDLKTPILAGFSKQALVNADFKLARKGAALRQFSMSGQFGQSSFSATMSRGDGGQPLINVATNDAGAALAFTDLYPRMEGGELTATMQFGETNLNGVLRIHKFFLRDEPALRRLVLEGNPRVDPSGVARVDPSLVRFDRLQVMFSRNGGRLDLRDGVMNGPNIGLTVEGYIDNTRETMALNGTFVPAYTVNNFFSKIPVVGMILGGGWNEGLFAVNYKVSGRPGAPQLSINPLSVAPGFLRKIFGALDGAGNAAPLPPKAE